MDEKFVSDLKTLSELVCEFNNLDEEDATKMSKCLQILLFRVGFIDGTYAQDADLYRYIINNYNTIDAFLYYLGLRLMSDSVTNQIWIAQIPEDEERKYTPFKMESMNGTQMLLLAILQKHLATGTSSEDTGADSATGVLLTEKDILKEIFPFIVDTDDEKSKRKTVIAAINRFVCDFGLLRLITNKLLLSDGSFSAVYRISPFVQHQFDIVEMDRLLALANEKAGIKADSNSDTDNTDEVVSEDTEELFVESEKKDTNLDNDETISENLNN